MNKESLTISGKTKITGSTIPSESDKPTNIKFKLFKLKMNFNKECNLMFYFISLRPSIN